MDFLRHGDATHSLHTGSPPPNICILYTKNWALKFSPSS